MEHNGLLNPLNEHHLWALHCLPPTNQENLKVIHTKLEQSYHESPLHLFTAGILALQNMQD